ncbi:MAG: hypothetical protein LLG01_00570 [Planctomycetaceae bacterium]|nr:hypothetical protein [Planctomycetaceae bacterium]
MATGKLHLLVLHFPLALIIVAALADALWLWRRKTIFQEAGYFCIVLGAAAAIPAMATGIMLISTMNLTGDVAELGEMHESLGIMTTTVAALAAVVRILRKNKLSGTWGWAYAVLIAAAAALVALTGHYGGLLAFGKDYLSNIF